MQPREVRRTPQDGDLVHEGCPGRYERRWSVDYSRGLARQLRRNEALWTHEAFMENRDFKDYGDSLQSVARPPFRVL